MLGDSFPRAGGEVVAVEFRDVLDADFLRADCFALVLIGAVSESLGIHLAHHGEGALVLLDQSLGKVIEVGCFCGNEEHGAGILAGGDAGTATDTGSGVERGIGIGLWNGDGVGIGCRAGADADETTGADDAVERRTVGNEVLDDWEGVSAEGLDVDCFSIGELTHVELTSGGAALFRMGDAIDRHGAHAADSFAAVVVEMNGIVAVLDEAFVDDIDHLQEGSRSRDFLGLIGFNTAGVGRVVLAPDFESQIKE